MEQSFACTKPPIGRAHASVVVDDAGVAIVHRMLKGPLEIPKDQIVGVVLDPGRQDGQVVLRREPRRLDLVTNQFAASNVVLLFDPPVRVGRFRYGADKVMGIDRKERKRGVDVDAIGVTVDDPAGLGAAAVRLGARNEMTITDGYVRLVGQAYGQEAATIKAATGRARRRAPVFIALMTAVMTVLFAVQVGLGGGVGDVEAGRVLGKVILVALASAAAIAILMAMNAPPPGGPLTPSGMTRARSMLIALAAMLGLTIVALAGAGWLHTHLGIPRTLTKGIAAGAPGGIFGGWALRVLRRS